MKFKIVNLREAILMGSVDLYVNDIRNFESRGNEDVENFIREKSVNSCKMKQSVTYLVYDDVSKDLLGYFTLTFKILDIPLAGLSNSLQKELEKNGQRTNETIQIPGVLLAQWSKNYAIENIVSGRVLMDFIEKFFIQIQNLAGGNFIFLECEKDKEHLLQAYDKVYGYKIVSERLSNEGKPLFQLIKKL